MINIKKATIEDVAKIADIYKSWLNFKDVLPEKLCEPENPEDIKRNIKNGRIYLLAEVDGEPAGVNYIDTTFKALECIRLGDFIVKDDHRNKGVGSALIDKTIKYAKENKMKKIWLWTQEELTDAIKLYEKKSFIFEGKQKSQFCGKDALLYGLVLE
ncbi:MAG: GNAT family N-acetyltransferase [Patescibacteria group bacterium]